MMNQDSLFGFFELFGCQFFFQEVHLLVTQPGKVVQTIIHPVGIRFVFTAVQHHDACVAPIEGTVGFIAYIIIMVTQTDGIGIAYFMVATHEESRYAVSVYSFSQFTDKGSCLFVAGRIVYTVTVEYNKIVIDVLILQT